jgi:hypothetical protein
MYPFSLLMLLAAAFVFSSCSHPEAETAYLDLYTVSNKPFKGGSLVKIGGVDLGHIAAKPDFVATNLLDVFPAEPGPSERLATNAGRLSVVEMNKMSPRLTIVLLSNDVNRFSNFTKRASGNHVVMMRGNRFLGASTIGLPITNGAFTIPYTSEEALKGQINEYRQLVR